jgi:hypothetical protein
MKNKPLILVTGNFPARDRPFAPGLHPLVILS